MDCKELFADDARHHEVLKVILESPFIERQVLGEKLDVPSEELDGLLAALVEKALVLELASHADSSIEARLPKTVFMINPEEEAGVREHM